MGRKKIFGITRYREIEKRGSTSCVEAGCKGDIKYVRKRFEPTYCEGFYEETFFYRCTQNCKHHWKAIKNSLETRMVFQRY